LFKFFNGTGWIVYTVFGGISTLISSLLILRSNVFGRAVAYIGIIDVIGSLGIFIPVVGIPLSLLATFGGVIWSILIARTFFQLGWGNSNRSHAA
jgi:hypothetical protein